MGANTSLMMCSATSFGRTAAVLPRLHLRFKYAQMNNVSRRQGSESTDLTLTHLNGGVGAFILYIIVKCNTGTSVLKLGLTGMGKFEIDGGIPYPVKNRPSSAPAEYWV